MNEHPNGSGASLGDILGTALKARESSDKETPTRLPRKERYYRVTFTRVVCDQYLAVLCDKLLAMGGEVKIERWRL